MFYVIGMDIMLKQIIKRLAFVIFFKNLNKGRIHCLINKTDNVRIT